MPEKLPRSSLLLICLMAAILYLPALPLREVRTSDEAVMADIVRNMQTRGNFLQIQLQGRPTQTFPLYPWLVAACSWGKAPTTFSLRFPAVLSIWGLAALAAGMAGKYKGRRAGFVAAAVVLTCCASFRVGCRGQNESLLAFLLAAAWFGWYQYGPQEQRWRQAWSFALTLVFLAVLNSGLKAVFFFYLPLFFARNPPKLLRQLQSSTHLIVLACFWGALLLWMKGVSNQPLLSWEAISLGGTQRLNQGFFRHLLSFPSKGLLYLLPWSLFFWAPFCLALRQFEPPGSLGGFFRALILSPLLLLWFWPGTSPLQLLPVLAPLAVLIGIHFEIVSARYRHFFNVINQMLLGSTLLGAGIGALFWMLVTVKKISLVPSLLSSGWEDLVALSLAVVLAVLVRLLHQRWQECRKNALPVQDGLIWGAFAGRMLVLTICFPLLFWTIEDKKLAGLTLAGRAPPEATAPLPDPVFGRERLPLHSLQDYPDAQTIYLASPNQYLSECFYLDKRIIRLDHPAQQLPGSNAGSDQELKTGSAEKNRSVPVVYLLSHRYPALSAWSWEPLSLSVEMNENRVWHFDWPGKHNGYRFVVGRQRSSLVAGRNGGESGSHPLRLYRGQPKT